MVFLKHATRNGVIRQIAGGASPARVSPGIRRRMISILLVVFGGAAGAQQASTFEEALELARAYDRSLRPAGVAKDIELAIRYYRRALELRPEHPNNMFLSAAIGGELLSMHGNLERQREGLAIFEEILEQYDHMDYYKTSPHDDPENPEYKMITIAIYAGESHQYLLREQNRGGLGLEKARDYYFQGMEMLDRTYWRRVSDWQNEPPPPEPHDPSERGEMELSKWRSRVDMWEERQQVAASGDLFNQGIEQAYIESLVRKYVGTSEPHFSWELAGILAPILDAFPAGSPFETEALRIIELANAHSVVSVEEGILEGGNRGQ